METKSILEGLAKSDALDDLLAFVPAVGPSAIITNNLDWSNKFREARNASFNGDYEQAAQMFHELDETLPGHDRFLTPAKINETFCWLRLGRIEDYLKEYEFPNAQGKIHGVVLWNLAVAYRRLNRLSKAEECIAQWIGSPTREFLARGYLVIAILQIYNAKAPDAQSSFEKAWNTDKELCLRTAVKYLGRNTLMGLVDVEIVADPNLKKETQVEAKDEVLSALQGILIPRAPSKYPQIAQQLGPFEYQSGYVAALEKFGDGDIDESLKIINSLLRGTREKGALLWAKAACLLAKREWKEASIVMEDELDDPNIPGGVLWNATCAFFNIGKYDSALTTIKRCTETVYITSPMAWLAKGLLAHLCGKSNICDHAISEAVRISPKQLVNYAGLVRQIGIRLDGLSTEEVVKVGDEQLLAKYNEVIRNAQVLLKQKSLKAAETFLDIAPESIADITEIGDITFRPIVLPTCPAELYDHKELFLFGVAAFQRKAYEEAARRFEDLFIRTDRSYPATVNLAASLIHLEKYSGAIDILLETIRQSEHQGANAIRNLISAFIRSGRLEEAFPWFTKLADVSIKEYFNFVQMAYVAQRIGRKEETATALFNACTMNLAEPSIRLKGAAVKACLEVRDYDRAVALVKYFVKEVPLPYVVAGSTRPIMRASDCKSYSHMKRQYENFVKSNDARAALAYFQEVHSSRESDYGTSIDAKTIDSHFNACMFYGRSLFWNQEFDKAHDVLGQAFGNLVEHATYYSRKELSKRYFALTDVYFSREHYFWAQELCERGLEADSNNVGLIQFRTRIETKIEKIPEKSRESIKELAELPLGNTEKTAEFLGLLPKVCQLVLTLPQDFPGSRKVVSTLTDLANALISLETVPIVDRKKEIAREREIALQIEKDMPLYLPKAFISALLPVLKGIKKTLDEIQTKSICPEFSLALEPLCYYRDNEASLIYKLRNIGRADIRKLRIRVENYTSQRWASVLEEQSFDLIKKDELLWIEWPIHLDVQPVPDSVINPRASLTFTGGSLRDEEVEQVIDNIETRFAPFIDISVDYPVVALKPEENKKLYGRENLLRTLKNSFTRSGQTRIPFLEGVRKVGKTSILYFLADRLTDGFLPVYVNLDTTWSNPYQLLAKRIGDEIAVKTGLEASDSGQIMTRDDFDRFLINDMRRTGIKHIVLLLDEFHSVIDRIESERLPVEFLGDLRHMYMNPQQKISVALADWYLIDELKSRVVPAQIWTDFAREPITFLSELDTREAILLPAQGSPVRFERDVVSRIYFWTNGYPWHIQWICSELINHLNTQKRFVVIPQDIDLIAHRLLREDRLFNEGVCRPERLSQQSQQMIYGILETLEESRQDIYAWFSRDLIINIFLPLDTKKEVAKLIHLEILQEEESQLRFCSPLHAKWFDTKRQKKADIYIPLEELKTAEPRRMLGIYLPENPELAIKQKCERLKELKSRVRQALRTERQIFKCIEMPEEWANASITVRTRDAWNVFIKALRDLFVEDMVSRYDAWEDRKKFPELDKELYSIRQRRNYVEHPDSKEGKAEEERCSLDVTGKRFPTSANDWLALQLSALDCLERALEACLEQIARSQ